MFKYDVGVIGIGRVGLPLALSLANHGLRVIGFDKNEEVILKVKNKEMPFLEKGFDELIKNVIFTASYDLSLIAEVEHILITVGTPLLNHIETDLSQVQQVVESILPYLREGQHIVLRSTVAPNTTKFVRQTIELNSNFIFGEDIFLSFCPERIAEGKAIEELSKLPQIIGCEDNRSFQKAEKLFSSLGVEIIRTNYISAELVKLFNNISRYVYFAVSNQFAVIADEFGANVYDILEMANYKYPRGIIAKPGFTAGTCLRKDFGMLNETIPYADMLLNAWKINEFMPKFMIDNLKDRTEIFSKNVAILGYTFKQDTDDMRDSLVPKLYRYIQREVPRKIFIHEPFLKLGEIRDDFNHITFHNDSLDSVLVNAEIIYIAVNHSTFIAGFHKIALLIENQEAWIIDLWNVSGTGKVFFQKKDLKI